MKKRQRRIAALLLACAVASVPVSQAFAETTYDVAAGVDAQILFPKDCLTNIAGAVTVDGAEAVADRRQHDIDDHVLFSDPGRALVDSVPGLGGGGGAGVQVDVGSTEGSRGRAVSHSGAARVARGSA